MKAAYRWVRHVLVLDGALRTMLTRPLAVPQAIAQTPATTRAVARARPNLKEMEGIAANGGLTWQPYQEPQSGSTPRPLLSRSATRCYADGSEWRSNGRVWGSS